MCSVMSICGSSKSGIVIAFLSTVVCACVVYSQPSIRPHKNTAFPCLYPACGKDQLSFITEASNDTDTNIEVQIHHINHLYTHLILYIGGLLELYNVYINILFLFFSIFKV